MATKRQASKDSLCFCEYENIKGERSHLLATLCDCEAIDSTCDNILMCQSIPEDKIINVCETIEDRFRIPYLGGAIKIKLDVVLPFLNLSLFLYIGAMGFMWTIFSISSFCLCLCLLGRLYSSKGKNQVFYSTLKYSLGVFPILYLIFLIGFRKVLLWEFLLLISIFFMTLCFLVGSLRDPGFVRRNVHSKHQISTQGQEATPLVESNITWIDSRPIIDGELRTECDPCGQRKPPRSGHCIRCDKCIYGRDHHCVWLNNCIGQHNHRSFFFFILLLFITGVYVVHLTMTTVCTPEIYLDWFLFPSNCRFLYSDFPTGLCVCCIGFTCAGLSFLFILLVQQTIHISQNITSLEMTRARKLGRTRFCLFARSNINDKGFFKNWSDFLCDRRNQGYSDQSLEF